MACELLKESLNRSTIGIGEVFCFHNYSQVIELGQDCKADIALVGEHLDGAQQDGLAVIGFLREKSPLTRSIFLARSLPPSIVVAAFQHGASGVFCRTQPIQSLHRCIRAVHQGRIWINSKQLEAVLQVLGKVQPHYKMRTTVVGSLTRREEEVANLVTEGLSNQQIAHRLGLSEHTVGNYLVKCYEKLGLSTRVELVLHILNRGDRRSHAQPLPAVIQ